MSNLPPHHLRTQQIFRTKISPSAVAGAVKDSGPTQIFWAKVQAVTTSPKSVTITIGGSSTPVAGIFYDSAYTPTLGDVVYGLKTGTDYFVLGKKAV